MTKDEALKLALEALEANLGNWAAKTKAVPAIRKALAQPEQNEFNPDWDAMAVMVEEQQRMAKRIAELEAQPEQEPVAWVCYGSASDEKHTIDYQQEDIDAVPVGTMLYTTPPQRTWVGLTDEEREFLLHQSLRFYDTNAQLLSFIKTVETKLRKKNT